jgi:hypothetical protein
MKQEVTPIEDFYQGHAEYTDERLLVFLKERLIYELMTFMEKEIQKKN